MILLDTNVVSEVMKAEPHPSVRGWFNAQAVETLFLSTHTVAEVMFGVSALPEGKRKNSLAATLEDVLALFVARVLSFDLAAARHYAVLATKARQAGKGFPAPDGYIAAIAAAHGFAVASRDASAFAAAGLTVIDPWSSVG